MRNHSLTQYLSVDVKRNHYCLTTSQVKSQYLISTAFNNMIPRRGVLMLILARISPTSESYADVDDAAAAKVFPKRLLDVMSRPS